MKRVCILQFAAFTLQLAYFVCKQVKSMQQTKTKDHSSMQIQWLRDAKHLTV